MNFTDRRDAGRRLAQALESFRDRKDVVVLALPRGGVPVAYEVARELNLPLDIFIVRKLGVPGHEELAMGAIASGGTVVINHAIVNELAIPRHVIEAVATRENREIQRRELEYRDGRKPVAIDKHTVIVIDDGLATGASMRAAANALRPRTKGIVVAVPVAAQSTCEEFRSEVDQVICATTPQPFLAVGRFYHDFEQTTDAEVRRLLAQSRNDVDSGSHRRTLSMKERYTPQPVRIPGGDVTMDGDLTIPQELRGTVLFAHGSGSSRHSPRNQYVARVLQEAGIATLLLDLLTQDEETVDMRTAALRFDIPFLANRLLYATKWLVNEPRIEDVKLGYFGASTGAAAALIAAAEAQKHVSAVVSRGGRPDLAGPALADVQAPTLLIVGGEDHVVINLNQVALSKLRSEKRMEIIPGATHLFEEPGTLEEVARLARQWFEQHLGHRKEETHVA